MDWDTLNWGVHSWCGSNVQQSLLLSHAESKLRVFDQSQTTKGFNDFSKACFNSLEPYDHWGEWRKWWSRWSDRR